MSGIRAVVQSAFFAKIVFKISGLLVILVCYEVFEYAINASNLDLAAPLAIT